MLRVFLIILIAVAVTGCTRLKGVGKAPGFTEALGDSEHHAMATLGLPSRIQETTPTEKSSLWSQNRRSLLGDRRAGDRGDIMTVVIEINDKAEISNSSNRSRNGSESLGVPSFFGIPQRLDARLPDGASSADAVSANSSSSSSGDGSVKRNEKLTLRVAATITDVLPNGVLRVQGRQEVRVNFEIRELLVSGFVRPEDISRQNEITYDKIASARISYGGRGQITDMQQPRLGQQISDIILPF